GFAADAVRVVRIDPTLPNMHLLNVTGNPLSNTSQTVQVNALSTEHPLNPQSPVAQGFLYTADATAPVIQTSLPPLSLQPEQTSVIQLSATPVATPGTSLPLTRSSLLSFGSNSYVQVGASSTLAMTSTGTIEAWIYPTGP